jgi:hypothetical protein
MVIEMSKAYTGNLAEQVIKGIVNIVMSRSLCVGIALVDAIAGIAQALPERSGKMLFPLNPNRRINLSRRKTIRAI